MRNGQINVDEFLKSVMNSEKFDEIAEKIADKAVAKFQKLKTLAMVPVSSKNFAGDAAYRVSAIDTKEANNSKPKLDNTEAETTSAQQHIIGKIDTEAFMKKESVNSLKHLSLKYKQFTKNKNGPKSKEFEENEEVGPSQEIMDDQSVEKVKKFKQRVLATKAKKQESNVSPTKAPTGRSTRLNIPRMKKTVKLATPPDKESSEISEDSINDMEDKSTRTSEPNENLKKETPKTIKIKAIDKHESAEDSGVWKNDEVHSDDSLESDSISEDDANTNDEKSDAQFKIRKPVYEYFKLPDVKNDSISINKSENSLEMTTLKLRYKERISTPNVKEQQKESNSTLIKPALIPLRQEGNKLYTYVKSPDYEDYHNEISRIQNQLKIIHP